MKNIATALVKAQKEFGPALKMKSQGRCERNWLTKNLVIGRKSLSQGMFE